MVGGDLISTSDEMIYRRSNPRSYEGKPRHLSVRCSQSGRPPQSRIRGSRINGLDAPGGSGMSAVIAKPHRIDESGTENAVLFERDNLPPRDGVLQNIPERIRLRQR